MDDLDARIAVLNVQKGDALVVRTARPVPDGVRRRIQEVISTALAKAGAPEAPVLVLDSGLTIEVLRHVPGKSPFITRVPKMVT